MYPSSRPLCQQSSAVDTIPLIDEIVNFNQNNESSTVGENTLMSLRLRDAVTIHTALRRLIGDDIDFWIAGGALLSLKLNLPVNDWDIFSDRPVEIIDRLSETVPGSLQWSNNHVANFQFDRDVPDNPVVQVIGRPFADPLTTINHFDFTVCCAAYDGQRYYTDQRFEGDANHRRLAVNHITYPLNTMKRIVKYAGRGFTVDHQLLVECLRKIDAMENDWDNINDESFYIGSTL